MTEAPARLKPLKGEASRIFKLCLEKDLYTALQGLELAAALGEPLEGVLAEVSVDDEGKLVRGKRFTAKDKTQAILDALLACTIPIIECHLSNLHKREPFRHHSWVAKAATGIIMGFGAQGYVRAVDAIADILKAKKK